jgi:hypothetical protein
LHSKRDKEKANIAKTRCKKEHFWFKPFRGLASGAFLSQSVRFLCPSIGFPIAFSWNLFVCGPPLAFGVVLLNLPGAPRKLSQNLSCRPSRFGSPVRASLLVRVAPGCPALGSQFQGARKRTNFGTIERCTHSGCRPCWPRGCGQIPGHFCEAEK